MLVTVINYFDDTWDPDGTVPDQDIPAIQTAWEAEFKALVDARWPGFTLHVDWDGMHLDNKMYVHPTDNSFEAFELADEISEELREMRQWLFNNGSFWEAGDDS